MEFRRIKSTLMASLSSEKKFMPCEPLFIRLAGHQKRLVLNLGELSVFFNANLMLQKRYFLPKPDSVPASNF